VQKFRFPANSIVIAPIHLEIKLLLSAPLPVWILPKGMDWKSEVGVDVGGRTFYFPNGDLLIAAHFLL